MLIHTSMMNAETDYRREKLAGLYGRKTEDKVQGAPSRVLQKISKRSPGLRPANSAR